MLCMRFRSDGVKMLSFDLKLTDYGPWPKAALKTKPSRSPKTRCVAGSCFSKNQLFRIDRAFCSDTGQDQNWMIKPPDGLWSSLMDSKIEKMDYLLFFLLLTLFLKFYKNIWKTNWFPSELTRNVLVILVEKTLKISQKISKMQKT
jgi:hypothetical protein